MAEMNSLMGADTSSYRPYQGGNMLEQLAGMTQIAQGQQNLKTQEYELATRQLGTFRQTLSSLLSNPNVSSKDVIEAGGKLAAEGIVTPQMLATELAGMPQDGPGLQKWLAGHLANTMDTQQKLDQFYGVPTTVNTGGRTLYGVTAPASRGGGFASANNVPNETDPTTQNTGVEWRGVNGEVRTGTFQDRQRYFEWVRSGRKGAEPQPEGAAPAAGGAAPAAPAAPQEPPGIAPNPQYPVGQEAYNKDLQNAASIREASRPLLKAIPLLEKMPLTGKGTAGINDLKDIASNLGIAPDSVKDEQTALGEIKKYVEQYARNVPGAQRSDAALQTFKDSNPNLNTTTQATLALAKQAIAWNRIDEAKAKAFQSDKFGEYPTHAAGWAQNQDSRAYGIDLMPPDKRQALLDQMKTDAKSDDKSKKDAAMKFWKSLKNAQATGVLSGLGE